MGQGGWAAYHSAWLLAQFVHSYFLAEWFQGSTFNCVSRYEGLYRTTCAVAGWNGVAPYALFSLYFFFLLFSISERWFVCIAFIFGNLQQPDEGLDTLTVPILPWYHFTKNLWFLNEFVEILFEVYSSVLMHRMCARSPTSPWSAMQPHLGSYLWNSFLKFFFQLPCHTEAPTVNPLQVASIRPVGYTSAFDLICQTIPWCG